MLITTIMMQHVICVYICMYIH